MLSHVNIHEESNHRGKTELDRDPDYFLQGPIRTMMDASMTAGASAGNDVDDDDETLI